jgi:hypothetical protein
LAQNTASDHVHSNNLVQRNGLQINERNKENQQTKHERPVITSSHTLVYNGAVVVEIQNAGIAELAVRSERRSLNFASFTVSRLINVAFVVKGIL